MAGSPESRESPSCFRPESGYPCHVRKLLLTVLAGVVLSALFAGPAFAQIRDPFDPAIDTSTDTGGTVTQPPPVTGDGGPVQPAPTEVGGESLANTGSDTEPWLVAAYGLIATGFAAVFISKTLRSATA